MEQEKFESWAIIELFGHARIAGKVTEESIGGCSFLRVDVPDRQFLGMKEVAALAGCSVSTIRRAADAGQLGSIRIGAIRGPKAGGKERLFLRFEAERFIAERRAKAHKNRKEHGRG